MTLKEAIVWATDKKVALGHFNISDNAAFRAIIHAAKDLNVPVIIGTSEGEADFVDIDVAAKMVADARAETGQDIFLNADHFRDIEKVKEAARAGYDSIIFDAAKLPLGENILKTKEAVTAIREINPNILVEGELGYIGESSKMLDSIPEGAKTDESALPKVDEVKRYVEETGIDLVAPAVGNLHGMLKNAPNPELKIELIKSLASNVGAPLVLHGGSGISDDDFKEAIAAGVRIIHINTEIRVAWKMGMKKGLENDGEIAPYKILPAAEEEVYRVVLERLKLFNGLV